jgi:branched-chain amino acid transport system substrate-binding protein
MFCGETQLTPEEDGMTRGRWIRLALVGMVVAAVAAIAGTTTAHSSSKASPVKVGIIYSRTGALKDFGAEYIQGFKLGLKYLTKGTNVVNGHQLQISYADDQTNPATAVSLGKQLIGSGYKILAGSTSSGVALQMAPLADQNNVLFISGAAASDAITGINRHTFRSGRQSYQDVLDAANLLPPKQAGKKIVVFAEDTAFGASNVNAVTAVFGGKGHSVSKVLVPFNATDLTPFAQQLKNANADLVFVAWAGPNASQMWQALQQQRIPQTTQVVTGLAQRNTYPTFGPVAEGLKLISHYVYQAPKNPVNDWLVKEMRRFGQVPDIFTPDGFVAAEMIVQAVKAADGDDVDKMIKGLENFKFTGPKGPERIRPEDHALLQPMFQVELDKGANGRYDAKVLKTISPGNVQPPIHPFPS